MRFSFFGGPVHGRLLGCGNHPPARCPCLLPICPWIRVPALGFIIPPEARHPVYTLPDGIHPEKPLINNSTGMFILTRYFLSFRIKEKTNNY